MDSATSFCQCGSGRRITAASSRHGFCLRERSNPWGIDASAACGDNPRRDIAGAQALGMVTVWIKNEARVIKPEHPQPYLIIGDLCELVG
jgi:ribonucleotide monophosphatase NagD (HAD superfamily)